MTSITGTVGPIEEATSAVLSGQNVLVLGGAGVGKTVLQESLMMVFFTFIFLSFRLPNTFGMECTEFCLEYPYFKRC